MRMCTGDFMNQCAHAGVWISEHDVMCTCHTYHNVYR